MRRLFGCALLAATSVMAQQFHIDHVTVAPGGENERQRMLAHNLIVPTLDKWKIARQCDLEAVRNCPALPIIKITVEEKINAQDHEIHRVQPSEPRQDPS